MARVDAFEELQAFARARIPLVHEPELLQMRVVERVQPPMRRLLPDEAPYFGFQLLLPFGGKRLEPVAHRVDEELFAEREAHRKRVEQRRAKCVTPAPMARNRRFHVDKQAAHDEISHGARWYV